MQTLTRLPRPRDVTRAFGIYVHIPFCSHRCWYCDFNAYAGLDHLATRYMDALARDAVHGYSAPEGTDLDERPPVTSIFIGGGTPSLVDPSAVGQVIAAIRDGWDVTPGAEVTIECNPESLDASKLDAYLESGINRVSIGVQSLDDALLQRLGRTHSATAAVDALELAQARGFANVSGDLIFGIPGEYDETWRRSVEGVLSTGPTHVSCYALTYEEGTPLASWRKLGKVTPIDDDDVAHRWEVAERLLNDAGLARYEISNWGRPAEHNVNYWRCGEYLGIGAGAHSHLATADGSVRSWTLKSPERYVRAVDDGTRTIASSEDIDERTRASEVMLLGLRRTGGVDIAEFCELVGTSIDDVFGAEIEAAQAAGLIEVGADAVRVSRPLLTNEATVRFV